MKLFRVFFPLALLAGLASAPFASARMFAGTLSGIATYQYLDVSTNTLISTPRPAIFRFRLDTTIPVVKVFDDGVGAWYRHDSLSQTENSGVVQAMSRQPNGVWLGSTNGSRTDIILSETPAGQSVTLMASSRHGGLGTVVVAGPPHAFFTDLDITTLHPGPIDLGRSSGSLHWFADFYLTHPTEASFAASPVPEPDIGYFFGAMLLIGATSRVAVRRRLLRFA